MHWHRERQDNFASANDKRAQGFVLRAYVRARTLRRPLAPTIHPRISPSLLLPPAMPDTEPRLNLLIGMLPSAAYERIEARLEPVALRAGEVLFEPDAPIDAVYFLADPIVSFDHVVSTAADRTRLMPCVAMTGGEGVVGVELFLRGQIAISRATVRFGGAALRLAEDALRAEFARGTALQRLLLGAADALVSQVSNNSVCERLHSPTQRLIRWLLLVDDRALRRDLMLTQETLAQFMGVRRETVSAAAASLQRAGLISYSRGNLMLVDRAGLEARSCACYRAIKARYDAMLAAD